MVHKVALIIGIQGAFRKSDYIRVKQDGIILSKCENGEQVLKITLLKSKVDQEQVFFVSQAENIKYIQDYMEKTKCFGNGTGQFWWQIRKKNGKHVFSSSSYP